MTSPDTTVSSRHADLVEVASAATFATTMARLIEAIQTAGLTIFATIDHAAGAVLAGIAMPPSVVIFYGRPEGGTPIMLATPEAALDLPLRVLVREKTAGEAVVAFHPIAASLARAGVPEALQHRLDPGQQIILNAFR